MCCTRPWKEDEFERICAPYIVIITRVVETVEAEHKEVRKFISTCR
jgi:hypothetical protein